MSEAPLPPRLLNVEQASAYCGMSVGSFEKEVEGGTFPAPVALRRVRLRLWDRVALDKALDRAIPVDVLGSAGGNWDGRKESWRARSGRSQATR